MRRYLTSLLGALTIGSAANASVTVNISQQGDDVVAAVSGTLEGLSSIATASLVDQKGINPGGFLETGVAGGEEYTYDGLQGSAIGAELYTPATSSSGILFLTNLYDGHVYVSKSYTLGAPIVSSATWANYTLALLGLNAGIYRYSIGRNDITFIVGVPEPTIWAMMLLGFGAIGIAARSRDSGARSACQRIGSA